MVVFEIKSGNFRYTCRKPYEVYELIDCLLLCHEPLIAIEASSWCELACVGEVYEYNNFTIEVLER